ncbi:dockerin type I domain-containing protein [Ruminococcus flavefaciens]|uniref:Dockerin domain-containing protein n=1 Tax=Ruminococcus flavefaciens 007c TaxID=1341157 RepID=W7UU46_RUMFL|nr:dockerin type I domain-containing protein [Ruminococcus flavefaciens]EWM54679.1 hypothetical protein RF007C_04260 [Ruminococcus flavefaciens 007c]
MIKRFKKIISLSLTAAMLALAPLTQVCAAEDKDSVSPSSVSETSAPVLIVPMLSLVYNGQFDIIDLDISAMNAEGQYSDVELEIEIDPRLEFSADEDGEYCTLGRALRIMSCESRLISANKLRFKAGGEMKGKNGTIFSIAVKLPSEPEAGRYYIRLTPLGENSVFKEAKEGYIDLYHVCVDNFKTGDINQDHFVDAADASQVLAMYVEASTQGRAFSSTEISLADMNRDNKIDSADASMILAEYVNSSTDYSG